MIIRCSICGDEYDITYQKDGVIDVAPHRCDLIELSFIERVCNNGCPNLIRCRRDGFDCREAWATDEDWIGGHDLYVRGDR